MLQITPECHRQWNKVSVLFIFLAFYAQVNIYFPLLMSPFRHFLYLLQAMFLIRQTCLLKEKICIRKKILKQYAMTHRGVESFWDIDNQEEVLNGKNLQSPDNSIKRMVSLREKWNWTWRGQWWNWLIFLFWREERVEGLYNRFHCRRTRTIVSWTHLFLDETFKHQN